MSKYLINIDNFQGPLDLLLHLLKEKNLDIFKIDVSEITDQYLQYLQKMEKLNLDIASEYLVMATYLLELKSHGLLKHINLSDIESEYEEDNRQELIERLLEYQSIKETTPFFKQQELTRRQIFTRSAQVLSVNNTLLLDKKWEFDLNALNMQLQTVYTRYQLSKPIMTKVAPQQISPWKRAEEILMILKSNPKQAFALEDIFVKDVVITNALIVVSFMAILDLVRHQQIYIEQLEVLEPITLRYRGEKHE